MRLRWLIPLLLLVAYGLTGVVQVRPGELAVVRRFGRVLPHKPEPGLWIGLPWGMDRVDRIAVEKIQTVSVGYLETSNEDVMPAGQYLTGDHNLVNVQVVLSYRVQSDKVEDYVAHQDRVESLLTRSGDSVLAEWVAARKVDDILLDAKIYLGPEVTAAVERRLEPYNLGVKVLDTRVVLVAPPSGEVKDAFDKVGRAQNEMETNQTKARQAAASAWQKALTDVKRIEREAEAYEDNKIRLARAEASAFTERLRKYNAAKDGNPNYLRQLWDEEMGTLLTTMKANRQLGPLDHLLHQLGLDLQTMPAMPRK
jgi:membrane protease subunit HflK